MSGINLHDAIIRLQLFINAHYEQSAQVMAQTIIVDGVTYSLSVEDIRAAVNELERSQRQLRAIRDALDLR